MCPLFTFVLKYLRLRSAPHHLLAVVSLGHMALGACFFPRAMAFGLRGPSTM
jgi:hypothetical protein